MAFSRICALDDLKTGESLKVDAGPAAVALFNVDEEVFIHTSALEPASSIRSARPLTELSAKNGVPAALSDLYGRPGFLLRRAHQIYVSMFMDEVSTVGITTSQYGALAVLRHCEGLDQKGLSRKSGLDRNTTAIVVRKLVAKGLVVCVDDAKDLRRNVIVLTGRGERVLQSLEEPLRRARERMLSAFSDEDATTFLNLLTRLVWAFNSQSRAPIFEDTQD